MRYAILAASLLAAAPTAQAEQRECNVVFVRAPEAVRQVIEQWIAAEPRCTSSLELRVFPTENGGLYLIAQRGDGRLHEREVPDAQSAGVLVASWIADDWTSSPAAPVAAPAAPVAQPSVAPPGMAGVVVAPAPPPPERSQRWISAGATLQANGNGGGVRAEIDLYQRRKWSFGIAAEVLASHMSVLYDTGSDIQSSSVDTRDLGVLGTVTRLVGAGDTWSARLHGGLGIVHSTLDLSQVDASWGNGSASGVTPYGELGVNIQRTVSDNLAVFAGVRAMLVRQSVPLNNDTALWPMTFEREQVYTMATFGGRFRL